jgi:hypothetical protein
MSWLETFGLTRSHEVTKEKLTDKGYFYPQAQRKAEMQMSGLRQQLSFHFCSVFLCDFAALREKSFFSYFLLSSSV